MITIVSGSYRKDNLTISLSNIYASILEQKNQAFQLLDFRTLPVSFLYENEIFGNPSEEVDNLLKRYIIQADKFIFITPEYNGSFPGIVKAFIDICEPKWFEGKKVALVGASTGRAGNLRGMDHLTSIFEHLEMHVLPQKVPVSKIKTLINEDQIITEEETLQAITKQIDKFIQF